MLAEPILECLGMMHATPATRWNLDAIESAYENWQRDPASVDASWRLFFEGFELGVGRLATPALDARCQTGVVRLIDAYRDLGHFLANLDPLSPPKTSYALLELSEFGLDDSDLDKTFDTSPFVGLPKATLQQLLAALRETYCRTIGVEYMHIQDTRIRRWLQERMEPRRNQPNFPRRRKIRILMNLHFAELLWCVAKERLAGMKSHGLREPVVLWMA